jgi:hypothetical protein
MVCSTATLTQMLLTRPMMLDPAASTDAWFRLDAQLRAAIRTPVETHPGAASGVRIRMPKAKPRPSAQSRRASARRQKALRQFVMSLVLLGGVVAYGPQISSAVGGLLAEQLTKNLTPSTACGDTAAQRPRQTEGHEQQSGNARTKRSERPQKQAAGEPATAKTESTETGGVSTDC